MRRVKRKIWAGTVLEQIVYPVSDRGDIKEAKPRVRFKSEAERIAHRDAIARRRFVRLVNANHGPFSFYSTFTFDVEHEIFTWDEARAVRKAFVRALRRAYPEAKILLVMGRGKSTARIHFHMISAGIPKDEIFRLWKYGDVVEAKPLRRHNRYGGVDHKTDYTGLASYLFDHWTEDQGGHRYYATRNHKKADREAVTEVKRDYTEEKAPVAPKGYRLVEAKSTAFGYIYYKYIFDPDVNFETGEIE